MKYYNLDVEKDSYEGYLYECITTSNHPPPITISETYLNFGSIDLDNNEDEKSGTLLSSITNHMYEPIEVIWYQGMYKYLIANFGKYI